MPEGNLPKHAKDIFNAAEASALKGTCRGDKGCAARVGWGAVKKKYKKEGDKWVAKSEEEILRAMAMDEEKYVGQEHEDRIPKELAGYIDGKGQPGQMCGDCQYFSSPSTCMRVDGAVTPNSYCSFFEQSISSGNMPASEAKVRSSAQFDMVITKASFDTKTGQRRWAAVASDTDLDTYEDRMSIALFRDFIQRIESGEEAPSVFQSDAWKGGLPYLGIAHYLDYDDGYGIAGDTAVIYIDGNRLKAKGVFRDNEVGKAAYAAIKSDMLNDVPYEQRTRISIAFVDWQHAHGEMVFTRRSLSDMCSMCAANVGDKMYTKGQLIHLALTRVPVNKRTPIWVEEKSMTTMREDALSIVGDEKIVTELEKRAKQRAQEGVHKAEGEEVAAGAVVVRMEESPKSMLPFGGATSFTDADAWLKDQDKVWEAMDAFSMLSTLLANVTDPEVGISDKPAAIAKCVAEFKDRVDEAVKRSLAVRAAEQILKVSEATMTESPTPEAPPVETPAPEEETKPTVPAPVDPLDAAIESLKSTVAAAKVDTSPDRLKLVQPALNQLAETIKAEVVGQPSAPADLDQRINTAVTAAMQPVLEQLALLAAKSGAPAPETRSTVPVPRAVQPHSVIKPVETAPQSSITRMIRKSVGFRE